MAEPLPAELRTALERDPRLDHVRVEYHPEVGSTNDLALERATAGAPAGLAILADLQRTGRGRLGRSWFSPAGAGLYLSVVTRPPRHRLSVVTLVAGIAAADAVAAVTGLPARLKWPNDLIVGRPWKKLGGVLCEGVTAGPGAGAVVAGIGINLRPAAYPPDVADRATSIEGELGRAADRDALAAELLARVLDGVAALATGAAGDVRRRWLALAAEGTWGSRVRWSESGAERRGVARDLADDGALIVANDGREERLIAGEVTWEHQG